MTKWTVAFLALLQISQCLVLNDSSKTELLSRTTLPEKRIRQQAWSNTITSTQAVVVRAISATATRPPAVLAVAFRDQEYLQPTTFPPPFCGFFEFSSQITRGSLFFESGGEPQTKLIKASLNCQAYGNSQSYDVNKWWPATAGDMNHCTAQDSYLCCENRGTCYGRITSCRAYNKAIDYTVPVDNIRKGTVGELMICDGDCVTLYNSGTTGFYCDPNTGLGQSSRTLLDTSAILTHYAGSTIVYEYIPSAAPVLNLSTIYSAPATATASPLEVLGELGGGSPPSCLGNMTSICPTVESITYGCRGLRFWPGPKECFCQKLLDTSCPQLCNSAGRESGAAAYLQWVMNLCNATTFNTSMWSDYQNLSHTAHKEVIPWNWNVQAAGNADVQCYPTSAVLGSFALVNILVGLSTLILGRRTVVQRLTCGYFGSPNGTPYWPLMALLSIIFNMFANLINALLVKNTPGFSAVPTGSLVLFWATRPRVAWLATALIRIDAQRSMYFSLGASSLLAEIGLQLIGSYYLGMTVNFARAKGYYKINGTKGLSYGWDASIMYAGALLWMLSIGVLLLYHLGLVFGVWARLWVGAKTCQRFIERCWSAVGRCVVKTWHVCCRWISRGVQFVLKSICGSKPPAESDYERASPDASTNPQRFVPHSGSVEPKSILPEVTIDEVGEVLLIDDVLRVMGISKQDLRAISFTPALMLLPFLGQWLFWAGFVRLARELYCPPPLWSMTAIWTFFSILGNFFGASQ